MKCICRIAVRYVKGAYMTTTWYAAMVLLERSRTMLARGDRAHARKKNKIGKWLEGNKTDEGL